MRNDVLWVQEEAGATRFAPLEADTEVDVAVVGGGIVGLAAAHLLAGEMRVAVLEARRIGCQATGRSTAKVTSQHGPIYRQLAADIGEDGARAYATANQEAVEWLAGLAGPSPATLSRADANVFAETAEEAEELRKEAELARRLGLPAAFVERPEIPVRNQGALRFTDQAQVNPYLLLRELVEGLGGRVEVHENTRVLSVEHGEPCVLHTSGPTIRARWAIVATQMPVIAEGNFFAKAYPHAHPVVAARADGKPVPSGMYISAGEPTRSFRPARVRGVDYVVAAGPAFRPGETGAQEQAFETIERFVTAELGFPSIAYRWTNEDFKPMDGLPFVGAASNGTPNLLVATGFNAWGISAGVVAARILTDGIRGREHPLGRHFDATRLRPAKSGVTFVAENVKAGLKMARDRALRAKVTELETIPPGGGGIVRHQGQQVAVSRDAGGGLTAVSAICTHLGCVVGWNPVDRTWDCPCHGSRFAASGEVVAGPAVSPLDPVTLETPPDLPG